MLTPALGYLSVYRREKKKLKEMFLSILQPTKAWVAQVWIMLADGTQMCQQETARSEEAVGRTTASGGSARPKEWPLYLIM